jgi:hypothetical protein
MKTNFRLVSLPFVVLIVAATISHAQQRGRGQQPPRPPNPLRQPLLDPLVVRKTTRYSRALRTTATVRACGCKNLS